MVVLLTFGWKHDNIMYYSVVNVTAYLKDIQNIPVAQTLATHQLSLQMPKMNRDVFSELPYRTFSNTA
jgi:hypothetical protein